MPTPKIITLRSKGTSAEFFIHRQTEKATWGTVHQLYTDFVRTAVRSEIDPRLCIQISRRRHCGHSNDISGSPTTQTIDLVR